MKFGKDTMKQADQLISALYKADAVPLLTMEDRREFYALIRMAKTLHRIAEHQCNGTETKRMESLERNTEKRIKTITDKFGLGVNFDGDPRGYVVKVHAPKRNVWNTWGGAETGYGIG